jgi:AcrR family transcriptional regulator
MPYANRHDHLDAAERLIEAAERLIGQQGVQGVSLREISRAAQQRNNYAVQYHFKDFSSLMQAIRERRMPEVERARAELLAAAKRQGKLGDTRTLTELLHLPVIQHRSANGERHFARFVLAMLTSPDVAHFGEGFFESMPIGTHVLELLQALHPEIPMNLILERQRLLGIMVLTGIFNRAPTFDRSAYEAALIENVLDMATAAIAAPVSPQVAAMVERADEAQRPT